tara:strand:+ start:39138 stop:39338 length:201 start_codon:yes stop_codon:yes gene_type:complete
VHITGIKCIFQPRIIPVILHELKEWFVSAMMIEFPGVGVCELTHNTLEWLCGREACELETAGNQAN